MLQFGRRSLTAKLHTWRCFPIERLDLCLSQSLWCMGMETVVLCLSFRWVKIDGNRWQQQFYDGFGLVLMDQLWVVGGVGFRLLQLYCGKILPFSKNSITRHQLQRKTKPSYRNSYIKTINQVKTHIGPSLHSIN